MRRPHRVASGLLAVCLALTASPAFADPAPSTSEPDVAKASARFKRGQELYTERNFPGALIEFKKAYEHAPNFRVLYNIGQVCFQMQDYVCAFRSLEQYLADGGTQVPDDRRAAVSSELSSLKQRIGYLEVRSNVESAEVSVDDVVVGTLPTTAPIPVGAGRHKVVVAAAGHAPVTRAIDVAGQDTATVDVSFVTQAAPAPEPRRAARPERAEPASPPPRRAMTTLSWVGYGVGVAALAGGAATGALALGPAEDVRSRVYPNAEAAEADRSRAATLALASDALLVTGLVTIAATTVLTFLVPSSARVTAGVAPGRFAF